MSENIFTNIPKPADKEFFEALLIKDGLKIERIVSYGHETPKHEWYDQKQNEWVILLKGEAIVSFLEEDEVRLGAGDYINIPAHKKHRVSWTKPNEESVWLTVHY
ncbi:cupin domain-containing protein [Sulfurimonas sp.]|jgi:cupin 2 domain-containing protein|uniref:cupin domain-containing protein n=1 Tax=Sulfurimonas sp. TaxID=2022749 RepID=UPI0025DC9FD7|nr:cupin domain-containing protein [Sulfurimonas sp.]MCK9473814.1 cupin domain-containing protein [Sulfurimonas sp.]